MCGLAQFISLCVIGGAITSLVAMLVHEHQAAYRLRTYHDHVWRVLDYRRLWGVLPIERHTASVQHYLLFGEQKAMGDAVLDRITFRYRLAFLSALVFAVASIFVLYERPFMCSAGV